MRDERIFDSRVNLSSHVAARAAHRIERSAPDRPARVQKWRRYFSLVQFVIRHLMPVVPLDDPCPVSSGADREHADPG